LGLRDSWLHGDIVEAVADAGDVPGAAHPQAVLGIL
jgi:hypothetical protein